MNSIYYHDASYARDHGELDDYRYSNRENFNCRSVIEAAIKSHFDGCRLSKQALADVLKYYRRDRVALVLAATVINKFCFSCPNCYAPHFRYLLVRRWAVTPTFR